MCILCLQALAKDIEVGELPVRIARFIARKQWIICGADDMMLRVYNYNTSGSYEGSGLEDR
jgi:coatomer subunit beta'